MKKRIFIIEKDDDALQMIEHVLQEEGYEVFTANTEFGIFELIRKSKPDLILLDLIHSTPQGTELNRALKSDATIQHIPVVMLSAHYNLDAIKEATFEESSEKPANIQKLVKIVES